MSIDDLSYEMESSIENGEFKKWIDEFPQLTTRIFAFYIDYHTPTVEEIRLFQEKGLDLNKVEKDTYRCDPHYSTPLHYACEYRRWDLIEVLIQAGADPNGMVSWNPGTFSATPIESVIAGHSATDIEYGGCAEEAIKVLVKYGSIIRKNDDDFIQECTANFRLSKEEWDKKKRSLHNQGEWSEYLWEVCKQI